jgi:PAS domain S-box-containing protein
MRSSSSFEISENPVLSKTQQEFRVLIRAPSINDASVTIKVLRSAGINGVACTNVEQVDEEIRRGCAMLIVAEEALISDIAKLTDILERQPPWSDLPIVIVTSSGEFANRQEGLQNLVRAGNIAEIERPFRPETLLSTVRVALRARQRQYEMRDLLQKVQNGEARIRQILESISDAFISIDTDWRIRFVNSAYMALVSSLFRAPEELVGHDFREKISDLGDSSTRDFYRRVMKQQRPESIEIYYTPLQAWLEIRAFPSPQFLSLYVRNITERRDAENNLRAAKESAEAANRSKDVFLAMLSHELRTPLTPILMIATSRERDGTIPPNLRIEMGVISRNVALETKLIDDLLDLSRITSGKVILERQAVDFNGAVKQVCETCKTLIIDRGIDFTLSLAENAVQVDADPARLQQILWNILQNAIKFSPQGGKILVSTSYPPNLWCVAQFKTPASASMRNCYRGFSTLSSRGMGERESSWAVSALASPFPRR